MDAELNNFFEQSNLVKVGVTAFEIFMLVMAIIYLVYALVLSRRIKIMNQNLTTPYEKSFIRIANVHILFSVVATALFALSLILKR